LIDSQKEEAMKTKTNTKGQSRNRLQALDAAELARVAGGMELCDLAGTYEKGTGWREFFYAAGGCAPDYYICTPR
jgi:hypothetical protein